jgi:hypothetical protein
MYRKYTYAPNIKYYFKIRISAAHPTIFGGDLIKKNEVGGTCSAYRGEQRRIEGFSGETWGKETTWKTQA